MKKKRKYHMSLHEYRKYILYMAYLDDEIARNELEGNFILEHYEYKKITFPDKMETLNYRYNLFFSMNKEKRKEELEKEIDEMEKRLEESKKYVNKEKRELSIKYET